MREYKREYSLLRTYSGMQRAFAFDRKLNGYELADMAGVDHPEVLIDAVEFGDLDRESLPDCCVVKPHRGGAGRGVVTLCRRDHMYVELLTGRTVTPELLRSEVGELIETRRIGSTLMVEQLVPAGNDEEATLPDDYKAYCLYDRPVIVVQRGRRVLADGSAISGYKFWLADWVDLGAVRPDVVVFSELQAPVDGQGVLKAVSRLGQVLRAPFCRFDMFEPSRGVLLGEVTPHPGTRHLWPPDIDELMGGEWEFAAARLEAERSAAPQGG